LIRLWSGALIRRKRELFTLEALYQRPAERPLKKSFGSKSPLFCRLCVAGSSTNLLIRLRSSALIQRKRELFALEALYQRPFKTTVKKKNSCFRTPGSVDTINLRIDYSI